MEKTNQTFKYNKELWTQNSIGSRSEIFFKLRQIKIHEMLFGLARPRPVPSHLPRQFKLNFLQFNTFVSFCIKLS